MAGIVNEEKLSNLIINKMSQDIYNELLESDQIIANQFYYISGEGTGGAGSVTSDIPLHFSINENGGLRITYDDGSDA